MMYCKMPSEYAEASIFNVSIAPAIDFGLYWDFYNVLYADTSTNESPGPDHGPITTLTAWFSRVSRGTH